MVDCAGNWTTAVCNHPRRIVQNLAAASYMRSIRRLHARTTHQFEAFTVIQTCAGRASVTCEWCHHCRDDKGIEIARAHLEAMHAVIVNKVTGDENEIGQQIASALETAVNKHAEFTGLLVSVDNPHGSTLEDILTEIRKSVLMRCTKLVHDKRPGIQHVLRNNQKILRLLDNAISYARDSTETIGGKDE